MPEEMRPQLDTPIWPPMLVDMQDVYYDTKPPEGWQPRHEHMRKRLQNAPGKFMEQMHSLETAYQRQLAEWQKRTAAAETGGKEVVKEVVVEKEVIVEKEPPPLPREKIEAVIELVLQDIRGESDAEAEGSEAVRYDQEAERGPVPLQQPGHPQERPAEDRDGDRG